MSGRKTSDEENGKGNNGNMAEGKKKKRDEGREIKERAEGG